MKKKFLAVMAATAAVLTGCSAQQGQRETAAATETVTETVTKAVSEQKMVSETQTEEEKTAADGLFGTFQTMTLDGEAADQDIFTKADLTMVNIWGTFCQPCISEMPELGELAEEYSQKGVQLVGIISDVKSPLDLDATAIVDYTGADYTHLVLSEDLTGGYMRQVQVVPTTVFLDDGGKQIGDVYTGARSKEEWSAILDELLGSLE